MKNSYFAANMGPMQQSSLSVNKPVAVAQWPTPEGPTPVASAAAPKPAALPAPEQAALPAPEVVECTSDDQCDINQECYDVFGNKPRTCVNPCDYTRCPVCHVEEHKAVCDSLSSIRELA